MGYPGFEVEGDQKILKGLYYTLISFSVRNKLKYLLEFFTPNCRGRKNLEVKTIAPSNTKCSVGR